MLNNTTKSLRKRIEAIVLLGVFFAFLVSCSSKDASLPITVIGEDSANIQAIRALESEYEAATNQAVDIQGYTFEESFELSNVDFASHTGKYDIVMQYNFSLSSFVRNDYVYPLDELKAQAEGDSYAFESDIFPNVWREVGYYFPDPENPQAGAKAVGYPFAANTMLMVYNKPMFEDADNKQRYLDQYGEELVPPATWEQYKRLAAFFTDPAKNTYGVAMHGSSAGWLYYEWTNFAFGMGNGVSAKTRGWEGDAGTPITLNTPENVAATQLFVDLKPYNKGSFFDVDGTLQAELMKEGNVAMALMWVDYLYPAFSRPDGTFDKRFGFKAIPGDKSMIAGGAFFINKDSKDPQAAFRFVSWLLRKENQIAMVKTGMASPMMSVYSAPQVQDIPYIHALEASLKRAVYFLEAGPDSDLISQTVSEYVQRAWREELSVTEALSQAQQTIDSQRPGIFAAAN